MSLYHIDADYLISFAEVRHPHHAKAFSDVHDWMASGEKIGASAVAWREFCAGKSRPRPPLEVENARGALNGGIVRFGPRQAEKSAELYNQIGRKRRLKSDCDVAATAILAKAILATFNSDDFKQFVEFGLRIANLAPLVQRRDESISLATQHRRLIQ